jgi:hypothetical protein
VGSRAALPRARLNEDGFPRPNLPQSWLWETYGSELLDADVNGIYELEPVAGAGAPWLYRWRPAANGLP